MGWSKKPSFMGLLAFDHDFFIWPLLAELSKINIKQDKSIKERSGSGSGNGSSNGGEKTETAETGKIITPNLKMFTFAELKSATRNFRPDTMLGEGGFGRVFKGWVDEKTYAPTKVSVGIPVAVKKSNPESEQGLKEWQVSWTSHGKKIYYILQQKLSIYIYIYIYTQFWNVCFYFLVYIFEKN